jgi:hypothetical protein
MRFERGAGRSLFYHPVDYQHIRLLIKHCGSTSGQILTPVHCVNTDHVVMPRFAARRFESISFALNVLRLNFRPGLKKLLLLFRRSCGKHAVPSLSQENSLLFKKHRFMSRRDRAPVYTFHQGRKRRRPRRFLRWPACGTVPPRPVTH